MGVLLALVFGMSLLWVTLLGMLALGPPAVAVFAAVQSLLRRSVPDATRGRVFGVLGTAQGVTALLGMLVASGLGELVGLTRMLGVAAVMWFAAGAVGS